jgi:hypothetical protein
VSSQPEQATLGFMNVCDARTNPPGLTGRVVRRRSRLGDLPCGARPSHQRRRDPGAKKPAQLEADARPVARAHGNSINRDGAVGADLAFDPKLRPAEFGTRDADGGLCSGGYDESDRPKRH